MTWARWPRVRVDDDGDVPVEAGVGADESIGEDPVAVAGGGAAAEAGFDLHGVVGSGAGPIDVFGDGGDGVVDAFVGEVQNHRL